MGPGEGLGCSIPARCSARARLEVLPGDSQLGGDGAQRVDVEASRLEGGGILIMEVDGTPHDLIGLFGGQPIESSGDLARVVVERPQIRIVAILAIHDHKGTGPSGLPRMTELGRPPCRYPRWVGAGVRANLGVAHPASARRSLVLRRYRCGWYTRRMAPMAYGTEAVSFIGPG